MHRTFDPSTPIEKVNGQTVKIGSPPPAFFPTSVVIARTLLLADWAAILVSPDRSQPYVNLLLFKDISKALNRRRNNFLFFYMNPTPDNPEKYLNVA